MLISARHYTFSQLTEAYNRTQRDYLVPMPMNEPRLREYTQVNDVDLDYSYVSVSDNTLCGLGMLGVRKGRSWLTRLGVIPNGRRRGTGSAITEALLEASQLIGVQDVWLEVIKGNIPAQKLFCKYAFEEVRELVIARRPPTPDSILLNNKIQHVTYMEHNDAIYLLSQRKQRPNWLNETESMQNVRALPVLASMGENSVRQTSRNLSAIMVELADGGQGWVSYQATFLQLTRIVVGVLAGDPTEVTAAVLQTLHQHHRRQDAIVENLPDDEQWLGFQQAGYFETFRRIEMKRSL